MKNKKYFSEILYAGVLAISLLTSCKKDKDDDDVVIIEAIGNISPGVGQFREILGHELNTHPGAVGGRREINWDGVAEDMLGKPLPDDFFNPPGDDPGLALMQRGIVYESAGNFMVSKTNFAEVNTEATNEFHAFSGAKTFANVSSELWNILPQVPGKAEAATVQGFGIVFSDVDVAHSTFMEFFSEQRSLGKFYVPVHDNSSSHSFLGVYFRNEKVTKVMVGHDGVLGDGQKDVSQQQGAHDLVVLDDFLYDEPVKK